MIRSITIAAGLLALVACGGDDDDDGPPDATWSLLAEGQPAALLSVWGTDADDVWVVGGRAAPGSGPIVLHHDGAAWDAIDTGEVDIDLWWVFGFDGGPVFLSGSGGAILRQAAPEQPFERFPTPGTAKVFGMWGAAPDDVWAVGGEGTGGGFAWHFDGAAWSAVEVPADLAGEGTIFKVSGRASDDVWMSCSGGSMLHWNGSALERVELEADVLFSVGTGTDRVVAVGESRSEGVVFEYDDGEWQAAPAIAGAPPWRGVAADGDRAYAVGEFGTVLRRDPSGWVSDPTALTSEDFHAAWLDPGGGLWVVGGRFDQPVTEDGVLLHKGGPVAEVPR
jgi:hypothetical protein